MPTRRTVLKLAALPLAAGAAPLVRRQGQRVVVVGAGAFGGWTALWLARRGARVTLIDAWGPGNMRASSGGETRVIRGAYGDRAVYTRLAKRALALWKEAERDWQRRLYVPTGALWMFGADASFADASARVMAAEGLPLERPSLESARSRWPQIDFDGVRSLMFEPDAGYLLARQSCAVVLERARAAGVEYRVGAARPLSPANAIGTITLADGATVAGDTFIFACGPWLGSLLPDAVGKSVRPTRQETYYFGADGGDARFDETRLPVWVDYVEKLIYGVPGNAHRGFKLADDTLGPDFDPTSGSRDLTPEGIRAARAFLRRRFPSLRDAPLLGGEVCQYENSPDSHFIIDRYPDAPNVWIVGGGSGHGFKMGPALGEQVADLVLRDGTPEPTFSLRRFAAR